MGKAEIKKRLRETIERDPHRALIRRAALFGSQADGTAQEKSDVDVLIDFVPGTKIGFFAFLDIRDHMEQSIHRKVDLLTPEALSPHFRDDVISRSEIVYES